MVVLVEGRDVVLRGNPKLYKPLVSFKSLVKSFSHDDEGVLLDLCNVLVEGTGYEEGSFEPNIAALIEELVEVFQMLESLLPEREQDHAVVLKERTEPIRVRPYCYPNIQKDEIEKMVLKMLATGIIHPSNNPFSSLVLLVRKKDGSWRFCVDYRALNKAAISDRFPIPNLDELLDEFHGVVVFSKLNLKSGYHQIGVRPIDVPKTAFRTHEGYYEFL